MTTTTDTAAQHHADDNRCPHGCTWAVCLTCAHVEAARTRASRFAEESGRPGDAWYDGWRAAAVAARATFSAPLTDRSQP